MNKTKMNEADFFDTNAVVKQVLDNIVKALVKIRKDLDGLPNIRLEKAWNPTSKDGIQALKLMDSRMRKRTRSAPKNQTPSMEDLWPQPTRGEVSSVEAKEKRLVGRRKAYKASGHSPEDSGVTGPPGKAPSRPILYREY